VRCEIGITIIGAQEVPGRIDPFALLWVFSGFFIWLALIVYLSVRFGNKVHQAEYDAWEAYQSSLKALKLNPTNADLKRKALDLGWAFMNMDRGIPWQRWNERYFGIPQWRWSEKLT
jgi:hypothetical protein